jgi:MFS family permease
MPSKGIAYLAATPFFLPVAIAILFIGLGDAVAGSYLTLFAVDKAHLSPLALGIFLTVLAFSGITIGLIGCQGINYIQALMPNRVGSAATLFSNTTNAGFLFAGLGAGGWGEMFGYSSMFVACAALSGLGLLMLYFQSKITPAEERAL